MPGNLRALSSKDNLPVVPSCKKANLTTDNLPLG